MKTLAETDAAPTPPPTIDIPIDLILWMASETAHAIPPIDGAVQRSLMSVFPSRTRVERSYRIFPSPRSVRFNEMEYELPAAKGPECLEEILATVKARDLNTLFPIEYRLVAADDCWLSPFYGRASASISIHQYHKRDYGELFSLVEPIFWKYDGRPHWGKLHTLTAKQLAALYPKWDAFQAVRRRLDPRGRFLNDHLRRVLGAT